MALKIRNLDKLAPVQRRPFVLKGITAEHGDGSPLVLLLRHAGDSNKGWTNAMERLAASDAASTGSPSGDDWLRARLPAFARFVIDGWENAFNEAGKPETYTPAAGEKLLTDLLDNGGGDLVHRAMRYSFDPQHFREMILDAEAVGKE